MTIVVAAIEGTDFLTNRHKTVFNFWSMVNDVYDHSS